MELTLKTATLFTTILLTGLTAGLFYAWSVSVLPGTRKIGDPAYLETMQSINRAILNPAFFLIFMGSLLLLGLNAIQQFPNNLAFWLSLAALLTYLLGTFAVTAFGNVPLNDQLEALDLDQLNLEQMADFRSHYELAWNRFQQIRTTFSVLSFILVLAAAFSQSKTI